MENQYRVVRSTSLRMEEILNHEWERGWKLHSFQHAVPAVVPGEQPIFILVLERRFR